ncbi:N-terminal binuclear Zn cluster-containing/DNA binding domain-containing protein [Emericellopsis atlantica]|uniref:N-terminal binuclear Zn cluster-containing/DNA binding domain-containing protein n=1 Tax=Emericellopsis atlantica TaxID=2614577 RepID=A0A9P7ZKR5_9HYPO|nr:N-terminal binuclear Zn cluster-containing/DNA binding domain-containing protein [Emericellopsis atlantica]KAG9253914.1 N-terminal binuclear Zn cluster-containing/DNA binding domain-containing protein [Emericellopsis atlantica]
MVFDEASDAVDPNLSFTSNTNATATDPPAVLPPQQTPQAAAQSQAARARESIPTACLACRSKHLKCDGARPCARCRASGSDCAFVASRRGYKGPKRGGAGGGGGASQQNNPNKRRATSPPSQDGSSSTDFFAAVAAPSVQPGVAMCLASKGRSVGPSQSPSSSGPVTPGSSTSASQTFRILGAGDTDGSTYDMSPQDRSVSTKSSSLSLAERCFESFYDHFHAAHPFVLPKDFMVRFLHDPSLEPLLSAMRWVGSLFIDVPAARNSLFDEAWQRVHEPRNARDGFLVQAMMVLIVGMDGVTLNERARELLLDVEKLAVEIALNTRPFAIFHGRGIPVLEESWRRTWWDLLVIDGMIAGVHRMTTFALYDTPTDVALPCEEHEFLSGAIPPPRYLEDLEDQEFLDDNAPPFSSFAYRILCARNLGKLMRTPPITDPADDNLVRVETLLTNWRLHLPPSKRNPLDGHTGRVDEMLFQAHMMLHATSIILHQPHSQLDSSPAANITSCAPHQAVQANARPAFNTHTRHTIESATAISRLVTLPVPSLTTHTHFFTCVLTLSSIVHLSKWALDFVQYDDDDLRQLLRLNVGALSELSRVWPAADRARGQVRGVASEVYQAKKAVQAAPQFWFGLTREQVMSSIAADDGIIEDVSSS